MNISTSIGSIFTALGSGLTSAVQGLTPLATAILPSVLPPLLTKQPRTIAAMPGGSPVAYMNGGGGVSYLPSVQQAGLFGGDALVPSIPENRGFLEGITGSVTANRLPRTVEGKDARGRTRVYVLAPMVKYKVSITRAGRRRCSGGR